MTKKKTRKVVKYRMIKLKLTVRQKKSLENYCKSRGTTPLKIIKKSIRPLLENYASVALPNKPVSLKQLELFEKE